MAETLGQAGADDPFASDLSFEERLRALESMGAEPGPGSAGAEQRLEALAAEVASLRERLRDQEKALVERIADVDDDRRLTGAQLQRGWQVHREELRARLRRQGRLTMLGGGLVLVVLVVATWYAHSLGGPAALSAEVAGLREDVAHLAEVARQDARLDGRMAALAATVGELATRPPPAEPLPAAGAVSAGEFAALSARVEQLGLEQGRRQEALDGLERRLQGLLATLEARIEAEDAPPPGQAPPQAPAEDAPTGTDAASPVVPVPPPVPAPAPTSAASPIPAPTPAPPPDALAAVPTAPAPATPPAGDAKVADRPFALQLLGSYDRTTVLAALTRPGLPETLYLFKETRRGRPWFQLIHSLHGDIGGARAALATLPPELKRPAPWVRELPRGSELEVLARER